MKLFDRIPTLYTVDGTPVFLSPYIRDSFQITETFDGLQDGSLVATNYKGETMAPAQASADFVIMVSFMPAPLTVLDQIHRNLCLAPSIIALIRAETLDYPELDPLSVISKLSGVVRLVGLGMFDTAVTVLATVETDDFLTTDRVARWSTLIATANAIQ